MCVLGCSDNYTGKRLQDCQAVHPAVLPTLHPPVCPQPTCPVRSFDSRVVNNWLKVLGPGLGVDHLVKLPIGTYKAAPTVGQGAPLMWPCIDTCNDGFKQLQEQLGCADWKLPTLYHTLRIPEDPAHTAHRSVVS